MRRPRETDDHYELDIIAPGRKKEDFKISIDNNLLNVSFTQADQHQHQDQKHKWVRNEARKWTRNPTKELFKSVVLE